MENNNENLPVINEESFKFVHSDLDFKKVKDEKMQTKSTTYARDAFKRFCKSKSSLVAAIIILVLMVGSVFIPVISPYKTKEIQPIQQKLLPPKLFKAGHGHWDGCVDKTGILSFDVETNKYSVVKEGNDFSKQTAIASDFTPLEVEYFDHCGAQFTGGYLNAASKTLDASKTYYLHTSNPFKIYKDKEVKATVVMSDDTSLLPSDGILGEYRVTLSVASSKTANPIVYPLTDWSKDYLTDKEEPREFDLSQVLIDNSLRDEEEYCRFRFEFKGADDKYTYIILENVLFSSNDEEYNEYLADFSIIDANATCLKTIKDNGLWGSNSGRMNVFKAEYASVSYRYDLYEHYLGLIEDKVIGFSELQEWADNGWCEIDFNAIRSNPEKVNDYIKITSDSCPLYEYNGVIASEYTKSNYEGKLIEQVKCNIQLYKYLGYEKMPKFIFGSDNLGRDLFTHAFRCLKNSLLLSIICCAICITIGLIWGSISGYYGGTVDLVMERITDLLSGVPSTVVLTLMLLLLGRTTVTFAFAVCLTGWIGTSSLTRTQFYRFKNRESVLAARTLGASDARLIFKHILPNSLGTIVTSSVLSIPGFIFTEASLSFLHLGLDTGDSFGVILSDNQAHLSTRPLLILIPSIILCLLMISFNLFGNGLRDALNPTLKGGE